MGSVRIAVQLPCSHLTCILLTSSSMFVNMFRYPDSHSQQRHLQGHSFSSTSRSLRRQRTVPCRAAGNSKSRRKAQRPGQFEVMVITPPKESLGIHALPPETHNGDQICVEGKDFVVSSLVLRYKLVGRRYQRDHNRLDVQEMSRYFLNMHLDSLISKSPGTTS